MYAEAGVRYRLARLFHGRGDGRTVIVPVDHGVSLGRIRGLEDPSSVLSRSLSLGADGILATLPLFRRTVEAFVGDKMLTRVAALDLLHGSADGEEDFEGVIAEAQEAAALGVEATKILLPWGPSTRERRNRIEVLVRLIRESHVCGLPCIVEPILSKEVAASQTWVDAVADASRVAVELGADVLKVNYPGDRRVFETWCREFKVPVILLGGPQGGNVNSILEAVRGGVDAGAKGIAMGRNVWQRQDVDRWRFLEALLRVVHEGITVAEAKKFLEVQQGSVNAQA